MTSQNTTNWYVLSLKVQNNESQYIVEKYTTLLYHDMNNKFIHYSILNTSYQVKKYFLHGYLMGYYGVSEIKYPITAMTYSKINALYSPDVPPKVHYLIRGLSLL